MGLTHLSETIVTLLIVVSIALLIFFIAIALRMVSSLSQWREKRRKKKKLDQTITLSQILEERFLEDMGRNR
jgi:biopolymer transport protein ExbB/TolQ